MEKSRRRLQLEESLRDDPADRFLRYGLALQCLRDGDIDEGRARLESLLIDHPDEVAAYQQLGQSFLESGDVERARDVLTRGVAQAQRRGDTHAASEMSGLLMTIPDA